MTCILSLQLQYYILNDEKHIQYMWTVRSTHNIVTIAAQKFSNYRACKLSGSCLGTFFHDLIYLNQKQFMMFGLTLMLVVKGSLK